MILKPFQARAFYPILCGGNPPLNGGPACDPPLGDIAFDSESGMFCEIDLDDIGLLQPEIWIDLSSTLMECRNLEQAVQGACVLEMVRSALGGVNRANMLGPVVSPLGHGQRLCQYGQNLATFVARAPNVEIFVQVSRCAAASI
jgi:hypothetical protein